jgi:ketosteroid isomerase-like protein
MAAMDRLETVRATYRAFASGDRSLIEDILGDDFVFHSPPDPELDRDGYFERCWPNSGNNTSFDFVRLIEAGAEVVVTYEATRTDGSRFRNTEIATFAGKKIVRQEVYFGWNLE